MRETIPLCIVPAGGYGSRMGKEINRQRSKPLMFDPFGKTFLMSTLEEIKRSNSFERVIVVTRKELEDHIGDICENHGRNFEVHVDPRLDPNVEMERPSQITPGVRGIPFALEDQIDGKPFAMICGHAPTDPGFIEQMIAMGDSSFLDSGSSVVTFYQDLKVRDDKAVGILKNNLVVQMGRSDELSSKGGAAFDNPHLFGSGFLDQVREFQEAGETGSLNTVVAWQFQRGLEVRGLTAPFPKEFDNGTEMEKVMAHLSRVSS